MAEVFRDTVDMQNNAGLITKIGTIGLGVKRKSEKTGKEYPSEVDFFAVNDTDAHVIADSFKALGISGTEKWKEGLGGPKALPVMLTSERAEEIAPIEYEAWARSKKGNSLCLCRGNGQRANRLEKQGDESQLVERPCPCEWLQPMGGQPPKCRKQLRIFFIVPNATMQGAFQIASNSKVTMQRIRDDIAYLKSTAGMILGGISGLIDPRDKRALLALTREPWTSRRDGKTHYCVRLKLRSFVTLDYLVELREILQAQRTETKAIVYKADYPRSQGNDTFSDGTTAPAISEDNADEPDYSDAFDAEDAEQYRTLPDGSREEIEQ